MTATRYDFHFDARYRPFLAALGVRPATAWVRVDDEHVLARFGPWRVSIGAQNIADVCPSGPYQAIKAIGTRLSRTDRGLTFGSTTRGGVCLLLREPVAGIEPFGAVRHPGLTLTVADREGFAAHCRRIAGL